jgi:epoxyqueuosine reductase QueG
MEQLTKQSFLAALRQLGAYDVRVANPRTGFEHAIAQRHPLAVMPECRSAIVFIVPKPAWANNTVIALPCDSEHESAAADLPLLHRLTRLPGYQTLSIGDLLHDRIWFAAAQLLEHHGHRAGHGAVQEKLCCHEAGIGVYGRSGLIIHPVLGNRFYPGVVLTDAEFEPDARLAGFDPCAGCERCVRACPGNAYRAGGSYPGNWSRDACLETRGRLESESTYCHECWRV